jgi:hypothetical protein
VGWALPLCIGRAGEIRTHDLLHPMNGVGALGGFWGLGLGFGSAGVGSANGGCLAAGFGALWVEKAGADFEVEEEA